MKQLDHYRHYIATYRGVNNPKYTTTIHHYMRFDEADALKYLQARYPSPDWPFTVDSIKPVFGNAIIIQH